MKSLSVVVLSLLCSSSTGLRADFSYQETTQITGGSMLSMINLASKISSRARDVQAPMVSTLYLKGNRMARISAHAIEIIDLDSETITNVDLDERTYTELTFAQMKQQLASAMEKAKSQQGSPPASSQGTANLDLKADLRMTGANKDISGVAATEAILSMMLEGQDTKTGDKGSLSITADMWLAQNVPGYDEMKSFNLRLAQKMDTLFSDSTMMAALGGMRPQMSQGMEQLRKESEKLKGVPIEQVVRMGSTADGKPLPAASEAALPPAEDSSGPNAGNVANQAATNAASTAVRQAGSKMGSVGYAGMSGLASGLGGFGKKKKQAPAAAAGTPDPATASTPVSGVLLETRSSMSNFSTSAVEDGRLMVPAGMKQVKPKGLE